EGFPKKSGKVRDVYDIGEHLLLVATDRISAYDVIMTNGIPDKGRVLTQISAFWFNLLKDVVPNHVVTTEFSELPGSLKKHTELDGRFMLCKKAKVVPIECVVRGYLAGSGWKEYQKSRTVCGVKLPDGLLQCSELPQPIYTPSTKAEQGHDENISFERACELQGSQTVTRLRDLSIAFYKKGREYAAKRGILLADTKFEFGLDSKGELMIVDEVLTPDSSRFWPADKYQPGRDQESFDKQFVRNYLDEIKFNRQPPGPVLPADVVKNTREKYMEAFTRLTGMPFKWA
ncbi:MAG TPA: phosphoribosylaminoimidazolesuccinocarboxamide synthase, partial [Phycisphaerae bacterium]|nr:phosphoribosylaminoimidazolesuccinocarboxamide synthase [Phycisphaerae bacterium]